MARVRNGVVTKRRHKKILKEARGYFGSKHREFKSAKEQLMHAGLYAYRDRRQKKRDMRKLWIVRINAACREEGISYSRFIEGLNKAGIEINRKMLSEIAINDNKAFKELVSVAKTGKIKVNEVKKETKTEKVEKVKEEKKVTKEVKKDVDLSKLTVAELREKAKKAKIEGFNAMKKQELIDALNK